MKSNKPARKYDSALVNQLLAETSEVERTQVRNRMALAARLDDLITAKGWNRSEFATKVGKSPSEITKWLSGTQNFTVDTLAEIALAFGIPVADLFAARPPHVIYKVNMVVIGETPPRSMSYGKPVTSGKSLSAGFADNYFKKLLLSSPSNAALS